MNRGRRGEAVFKDKKDYIRFIELRLQVEQLPGIPVKGSAMELAP
jgi:hypothetical protein